MVYSVLALLVSFAAFLASFNLFLKAEARKFGDNQFRIKLLPPPPKEGWQPPAQPFEAR